jgi:hypothetical protein
MARIAGWGLPSPDALGTLTSMKQIEVEVFPPDECAVLFGDRIPSPRRQLCAANRKFAMDSCAVSKLSIIGGVVDYWLIMEWVWLG